MRGDAPVSLFMTPREAAERWGCTAGFVRKLCRSGELPAMRLGLEAWRISLAAVEAYERRHTSEATEAAAPSPNQEIRSVGEILTTSLGFELPADYRPVFPALWPGHEPQNKKKRLSAVTKNR